MMMRAVSKYVLALSVLVFCAGCISRTVVYDTPGPVDIQPPKPPGKKDYYRQLPPGTRALRKITDPMMLPDFRLAFTADNSALLAALEHSENYFTYPSSRRHYPMADITHARASDSLVMFRTILESAASAAEFHQRILFAFDVYQSAGCDNQGTVLFTGYFTPIFDARLQPDAEYRWPLYGRPPGLVKNSAGKCLGRLTADNQLVPYYTRAEIENGALAGQEIVWLKDRFEAYIVTVQGSAKLRLKDGSVMDIGYSANNGHKYSSVGLAMLGDGVIRKEHLSLSGLIQYFRTHPQKMAVYLQRNKRYVFFRKSGEEPRGSIGMPVTPGYTLATDKAIFPRGCLTFVNTSAPTGASGGQKPFRRFMLDQDTGGAIRAPGRADIYVGVGDEAGRIAGWTYSEGALYYLFLKQGTREP